MNSSKKLALFQELILSVSTDGPRSQTLWFFKFNGLKFINCIPDYRDFSPAKIGSHRIMNIFLSRSSLFQTKTVTVLEHRFSTKNCLVPEITNSLKKM